VIKDLRMQEQMDQAEECPNQEVPIHNVHAVKTPVNPHPI